MRGAVCLGGLLLIVKAVVADPPTLPAPTPLVSPTPTPSGLNSALDQLRHERSALEALRRQAAAESAKGSSAAAERAKLRLEIAELLQRWEKSRAGRVTAPAKEPSPPSTPRPDPLERPSSPISDRITLAQVQYRGGKYADALRTIDAIDRTDLSPADRAWLDYLKAGCLRHEGKLGEALALYREIASAKDDSFLSESATWQVSFIRWRQEIQTQIENLRRTP